MTLWGKTNGIHYYENYHLMMRVLQNFDAKLKRLFLNGLVSPSASRTRGLALDFKACNGNSHWNENVLFFQRTLRILAKTSFKNSVTVVS